MKLKKITSYVKLQDAFVAEMGDYVGKFEKIGYDMPSTTSFDYTDKISADGDVGTTAIPSSATAGWEAKSKVALNSCNKGATWTLQVAASSTGNGLTWTPVIANGSGKATDCEVLTPRFNDFH